jgi:hypothetical protein
VSRRIVFAAYAAATAVHVGFVMAREPFEFDAWNIAVDTGAQPFSLGRFFAYWKYEYTHSNPRIGQAFTYLAYKLSAFAVITTPLAFLALTLAVFVLATTRWPRRNRDLALWAIAIGSCWFALPQIGKTMFCRAYGANYLYGAVLQLWFLVPLRLGVRASPGSSLRSARGTSPPYLRHPAHFVRSPPARLALYALAGVIAGLCNEHTGPALCLFMALYAWRSRDRFVIAGAAGVIAGFAAIFFAPGQGERYEGLAQQVSLVGRLVQRGVIGNLEIFRDGLLAAAPLLGLIAIVCAIAARNDVRPRAALNLIGGALIAAIVVTATIFVSPKLGSRFFVAPMALLLAGFVALCDEVLTTPRRLAPFVVLAVAASGYAAARTVPMYARLADQSAARITALEATKPGTVFTAESFEQVDDSWWFLGDDFRDIRKRRMVRDYFALAGVVFRAYDADAPLAVSDVRLVPEAGSGPVARFELDGYRALDIDSIHKATLDAIARLDPPVDHLDLAVEFTGARPELPRAKLYLSRWTPTSFEHYAGAIRRESRTTRVVDVPKEVAEAELYIFHIAGKLEKLDASHRFTPWGTGIYWALACRGDACFVFATAKLGR